MIFPKANVPVSITLYGGVPFDNKYDNHPFMPKFTINGVEKTEVKMSSFLETLKGANNERLFPKHELNADTYNFDYSNGLITSITLMLPEDVCDYNYMYVKALDGNYQRDYYYFITGITILNASADGITCKLSLELDVIATYQQEIMNSTRGIPLNTERKHSHRFKQIGNKPKPYCCDLVNDEPVFSGLKPSIIDNAKKDFELNILSDKVNITNAFKNCLWVYIQTPLSQDDIPIIADKNNKIKDLPQQTLTYAIPISYDIVRLTFNNGNYDIQPYRLLLKIFDEPNTLNIKISPFPPFTEMVTTTCDVNNVSVSEENGKSVLNFVFHDNIDPNEDLGLDLGNCSCAFYPLSYQSTSTFAFLVIHQKSCEYKFRSMNILDDFATTYPTYTTLRDIKYEPKLYVSPCRKYLMKTTGCEGKELYPQLVYSKVAIPNAGGVDVSLVCLSTINVQDLTFSYFPDFALPSSYPSTYANFKESNMGLIFSPNYTLATGKDALKYFNQTQSQQFTTSKIISGVTGAVGIVGGVALAVASKGTLSPLSSSLVKGGITAVGGAIATASAITSATSKYNDLKNTPDEYNGLGSTIYHDYVLNDSILPYLVVEKITPSEEEMLLDYFYDYGYNSQRCCYLNEELIDSTYSTIGYVDNNLITRETFNYVKLGEDITNKLHTSKIPQVCKNKLASIFQNGIKLYTFIKDFNVGENKIFSNFYDYYENNKYENVEVTE